MIRGKVKWFNPDKGYGFILIEDKTEVFVHHTAIKDEGFRTLNTEEIVEFELINTSRGFQAKNVTRLGMADKEPDPAPVTEPREQTPDSNMFLA